MSNLSFRPADLIIVRRAGFVPRVIQHVTHSPYDHVAGWVKENELIEADAFRKTGYQALDFYDGQADVYTCDVLTDEQRKQIITYVQNEVGSHYDYVLIVWELIRYLLDVMLPFYEGKRRICSTLWSDAYRSAGVDLCPTTLFPSPADLANSSLLRKMGSY